MAHPSLILWMLGAAGAGIAASRPWGRCGEPAARWWLAGALVVLLAVTVGPVDRAGEERSLTVHVLQHMALFSVVPVLLLRGVRPALQRLDAPVTPGRAAALMAIGMAIVWGVHVPIVMDATLSEPAVNDVSHVALLGAGVLLAWPLMAASPLRGMPAVGYLVAAELAIGALGIVLTWAPDLLYAGYGEAPALWGFSRDVDQMAAGAALLAIEEPFLAVELAIVFMAALADDEDEDAYQGGEYP